MKELEFHLVVVEIEFEEASLSCADGLLKCFSVLPMFMLHNHVS